jgi:hypothetical protein
MKALIAVAFAVALFQVSCPPSFAQGMMMMPTCAAGDPVVGVNTKTKMYMSKGQMKMHMMGMSTSQKMMMMKKNHIKMMCKSKADAMGAMMMKPM